MTAPAEHGSLTQYRYGCRCTSCSAAKADYASEYESPEVRDDQHGTVTGYKYGCRCISCRDAMSEQNAAYRMRRRQACGVPAAAPRPAIGVSHSRPRIELEENGRYSAECSCGWWARSLSRREVERDVVQHARAAAKA